MSARLSASNSRCGDRAVSVQSICEPAKVSGACGSGKARSLKKDSYSRRRPSDTALASAGSAKLVK